jgi:ribonuclease Z
MTLFDCGEGTQVSLKLLGWGFKNINNICFTHYHADHISGLPGLLLTIGNTGRTEPVRFFGPQGLEYVVKCLCVIAQDLPFGMEFIELEPRAENVFDENDTTLRALPVNHRAPCYAYTFTLKRRGKFDAERAKAGGVPMEIWSALQKQNNADIVYNNRRFTSDMVIGPPRRGLKRAFCTDTRPLAKIVSFVSSSDLFICEGLYGEEGEKAASHMRMSFAEAAAIAKKAGVKKMWLTHFSPAVPDPYLQLSYATDIFPDARIGRDRMTKTLKFDED